MNRDETHSGDLFFEHLAGLTQLDDEDVNAPSRLKSKVYSNLVTRMQDSGPLQDVQTTRATHPLCVFESLVQITPLGEGVGSANFCRICHARILAERLEAPPIYWSHCPYVRFQNR